MHVANDEVIWRSYQLLHGIIARHAKIKAYLRQALFERMSEASSVKASYSAISICDEKEEAAVIKFALIRETLHSLTVSAGAHPDAAGNVLCKGGKA